ncbi:hypothetical protein ACFST9_04175 [Hymenobacter monticola]|uniref:Uncharacterized protein n=1 Tax=Hymenobacter monticola TaxID=1705399 RepID=A0ABY4B221_9BACT|nr:hypothetical protein [Hymenobacter monticola]UOE32849.1 hypothetical protein MTP16_17145 [Hymenobacter monticola]
MSTAYTNRIHDIKYIYDSIEQVSIQHPGFAHFDSGSDTELGKPDYSYPLLYLETIGQVTESTKTETYSIALNICDRIAADPNHRQRVEGHSKVKQLFSEAKRLIELLVGAVNVSDANILFYDHLSSDDLVAVRGEFTITVKRFVNPHDVKQLLEGGAK